MSGLNDFWTQADAAIIGFFSDSGTDPAARAALRNDWPLHRIDHAAYIVVAYLIIVLGGRWLREEKNAPAEQKDKPKDKPGGSFLWFCVALYNITQVVLCTWMVYASIKEYRRRGFSVVCNPYVAKGEDGMAFILHIFYLSKVLDFLDTIFMVVKKNWRQMSFLHVYHHSSIVLFYWLNAHANFDGDIYLTIVLNGSIHAVMYSYYLLTSCNVKVPVFIKKSITNAQLVQFCCMEAQGAYLLTHECGAPQRITVAYMLYISTMLILFMNFRQKTYTKPVANGHANGVAKAKKGE